MTAEFSAVLLQADALKSEEISSASNHPNNVLKEELNGVIWCDSPGEDIHKLVVERVRNNERLLPDRKETITYDQLQVNAIGAVMLMPRGATYIYDIEYDGAEIEYGYVVSFFLGDKKTSENIVRGKIHVF